MLRRFAAAWRFLTPFPLSFPAGIDEGESLRSSTAVFPLVGLALGCGAAAAALPLGLLFPAPVTAALGVAMLAASSGGFHLDGLADSADGLASPGRDREAILDIMKDSRIGAHGVAAMALVLLVKYACLSSLATSHQALALAVAPLAGRAAILPPIVLLPYARKQGLGTLFSIDSPKLQIANACLWTAAGMLAAFGFPGMIVGMGLWLGALALWIGLLRRRLGGATGDTYGAACEFGETAACLAAAFALGT